MSELRQKLKSTLARANNSQKSIVWCSDFILKHCNKHPNVAVQTWFEDFSKYKHRQLLYLYIANDVLQKDRHNSFKTSFIKALPHSLYLFSKDNSEANIQKAKRIVSLLNDRNVLTQEQATQLNQALGGQMFELVMEKVNVEEIEPKTAKPEEKKALEAKEVKEESVEWQGTHSYETIRTLVQTISTSYPSVLTESTPTTSEGESSDPTQTNTDAKELSKVYESLHELLDKGANLRIQDDLIGEKVMTQTETLNKILEHKASEEDKASEAEQKESVVDLSKKKAEPEENEMFKVKITEEKYELDLTKFNALLEDYLVRLESSIQRHTAEMEQIELALSSTETNLQHNTTLYTDFKNDDIRKISNISSLIQKQLQGRKRKREQEEAEKKKKLMVQNTLQSNTIPQAPQNTTTPSWLTTPSQNAGVKVQYMPDERNDIGQNTIRPNIPHHQNGPRPPRYGMAQHPRNPTQQQSFRPPPQSYKTTPMLRPRGNNYRPVYNRNTTQYNRPQQNYNTFQRPRNSGPRYNAPRHNMRPIPSLQPISNTPRHNTMPYQNTMGYNTTPANTTALRPNQFNQQYQPRYPGAQQNTIQYQRHPYNNPRHQKK